MTGRRMHPDVLIIGAGPVGLLLACLLGQKGRAVTVMERRTSPPASSMAIGITPPSLHILERIGLGPSFEAAGVPIRVAQVFENRRPVGSVPFDRAGGRILSLPQRDTVDLLRGRVLSLPSVRILRGVEFDPQVPLPPDTWIIGCDGHRSSVRTAAGIGGSVRVYPQRFVMADFEDDEPGDPRARLFFSACGSVESFPLPGGRRRWVAQVLPGDPEDVGHLVRRVEDAAGVDLHAVGHGPPTVFQPRRALAHTFCRPPFLLCGDAAHVLSPIGGQGMNTGFADAWMLSSVLDHPTPSALAAYTRHRRHAFQCAARRAAWGMWLGTRTGTSASRIRSALLAAALRVPTARYLLSRTYAMLNLPHPVQA